MNIYKNFAALFLIVLMVSCRGYYSKDPPFHVNPNMDRQEKVKAFRVSDFFDDKSAMREPIEGTIARGELYEDEHFYFGKVSGEPAKSFPSTVVIDDEFMKRGKRVYEINCAACHSQVGDGKGRVGTKLLVQPTSFHSNYLYNMPPGHFFDLIKNGIRTMPSYRHMINTQDIWSVVAYVRALQISQDSEGDWIKRSAGWWR